MGDISAGAGRTKTGENSTSAIATHKTITFGSDTLPGDHGYTVDGEALDTDFLPGAIYTVLSYKKKNTVFKDIGESRFAMPWITIQFFVITMAEVLISITGLEFAYKQAPIRMKSLLQSAWLFTLALGNIINTFLMVFSTDANGRDKEFFVMGGALFVMAAVMAYMGSTYEITTEEELQEIDNCPDIDEAGYPVQTKTSESVPLKQLED